MAETFALMVAFYQAQRPEGALPEDQDGDMLLFEWGTFDLGHGDRFTIGLTRQIIYPYIDPDDPDGWVDQDIWQLTLNYGFVPTPMFDALSDGSEWAESPAEAPAFLDLVLASAATSACGNAAPDAVTLEWRAQ